MKQNKRSTTQNNNCMDTVYKSKVLCMYKARLFYKLQINTIQVLGKISQPSFSFFASTYLAKPKKHIQHRHTF